METFSQGKFPREVGKKLSSGFIRNLYVRNAEELASFAVEFDYFRSKDRFVTVYSFDDDCKDGERWNRNKAVVDRLFIDIDCEDLRVSLREAQKLVQKLDCLPIVTFSGAKGFHVHVLFEPVKLKTATTLKAFGAEVVKKFSIRHADTSVFERARLCRLPYTQNSKTGLYSVVLDPERLGRMTLDDVIRLAKRPRVRAFDVTYADWSERLKLLDEEITERIEESRSAPLSRTESQKREYPANSEFNPHFRRKRIAEYLLALRMHGRLSKDPAIVQIHAKSRHAHNLEAVEHLARVYLVLLMIEEGYSDEEIHAAFRYAEDYSPEKTQYYIDYNRKWLLQKHSSHALSSPVPA
jgi:hypothetical protein